MKRTPMRLLVAIVVLGTVGSAADRIKGTFLQHATEGYYYMYGENFYLQVDAVSFKTPSGVPGAHIWVYLLDDANARSLYADGDVPTSMMKVTGNTLAINIPDLNALLPNMRLDIQGVFPDTLPVNCTMTPTSIHKGRYTGRVIERDPTTGAKLIEFSESYTETWASIEGVVVTITLPQSGIYGEWGSMKMGDYEKSHSVN